MGGGQLGVAYDAGAARSAVHAGEGHGTGLGPWLWLETEIDRVLRNGSGRVGWRFPRQVSTLRTLQGGRGLKITKGS